MQIRQVQPHGPYILGGYSGGGLTAWEVARLLEEAGEAVARVFLLDTPMPMRPVVTRQDKALMKLIELRRNGPRYFIEWFAKRRAWNIEQKRKREAGPHVAHATEMHIEGIGECLPFGAAKVASDAAVRACGAIPPAAGSEMESHRRALGL